MTTTLKIYGERLSRAERTLWAADECGLSYEHLPDPVYGDKSEALLAINPEGTLPTLDDNGYVLTQSWAINLYLARKYGGDLASKNVDEEAEILRWTFWAATDAEGIVIDAIHQTGMIDPAEMNMDGLAANFSTLEGILPSLNQALAGREYLAADRFTVGDLNVSSVVSWLPLIGFDLTKFGHVKTWNERCISRPHFPKRG